MLWSATDATSTAAPPAEISQPAPSANRRPLARASVTKGTANKATPSPDTMRATPARPSFCVTS